MSEFMSNIILHIDDNTEHNRRRYDGLSIEQKVDEALLLLDAILYAFPEGPSMHKEMHESFLAAKRAEADFWRALKLDIVKKGLWGLIVILVGLVVVGITTKLGVHNGP